MVLAKLEVAHVGLATERGIMGFRLAILANESVCPRLAEDVRVNVVNTKRDTKDMMTNYRADKTNTKKRQGNNFRLKK